MINIKLHINVRIYRINIMQVYGKTLPSNQVSCMILDPYSFKLKVNCIHDVIIKLYIFMHIRPNCLPAIFQFMRMDSQHYYDVFLVQ